MPRRAVLAAVLSASLAAIIHAIYKKRHRGRAKRKRDERDRLLAARKELFAHNLSVSYKDEPLLIEAGHGAYLFDNAGKEYLDCVNNVAHTGHCHPKVVAAACGQLRKLNTNTRYLSKARISYAQRLLGTFESPLEVLFLVCSGSEANDLALRLARAYTGGRDVIVQGGAYHGHTSATIECSPYKFEGRGGFPQAAHIHQVPAPDTYRGSHRAASDDDAGASAAADAYAALVAQKCREIAADGGKLACMLAESVLGCAGQIVPPPGYLAAAFDAIRQAGGVCIADEVQIGFGRCGASFWAFQAQGARPDIVTLGKPMGSGYPMGGVVTSRAIAESFAATGMEYFNTFGGSTVACVVGEAVLDVIRDEKLQQNAAKLGAHLLKALQELSTWHTVIGDVRGVGLFLGVELVLDRETREPAAPIAEDVTLRCRRAGVLLSTDGPHHNIIKIKPPMCITAADADILVAVLDTALREAVAAATQDGEGLAAAAAGTAGAVAAPPADGDRRS